MTLLFAAVAGIYQYANQSIIKGYDVAIATAVEEQSAATQEIASNIAQASTGIHEVNENVNNSSEAASTVTEGITT